uniref:holo-[acyl-carrier-protein] synthase n=1 Tax=Attheya septentrionalis TaxID=420275 RepID=A0A6T7EPR9_9STRA|mmetsp:Transcript_11220/g.20451  ORF Transcript_11220/g.20451 Transcript_11220/m.20451 type:complete len:449 (+) Transcript_11220:294-1640(+)|eukprot:CAMPEP_0198287806 /NCGR_PEP_ID=MMETSP1449-20131203/6507_1 /TAXON_ID=420275 /ORGANISM="Attheya septentrionalis, Strain CCMP2084" /LENGTH=448 /DNA_ID=CAMNT_0043985841 /DNA_START=249 /DNA_END=1595 /DNA_ORIENTATION=-
MPTAAAAAATAASNSHANEEEDGNTIVLTCVDLQSMEAWSREKVKDWIQSSVSQCRIDTSSTTNNDDSSIVKPMFKYIKGTDQCIALTSTLLKSRAYYQTPSTRYNNNSNNNSSKKRPLQTLPRTPHGKPFVSHGTNKHAMSISHQFPICALSHYHSSYPATITEATTADAPDDPNYFVGLDVVMFDPPNPKLYTTQNEFLDMFRDSFTEWEWNRIRMTLASSSPLLTHDEEDPPSNSCCGRLGQKFTMQKKKKSSSLSSIRAVPPPMIQTEEDILKEFYLRWSIKEAYTKALGVGMGLDFGTFETRLQGVDVDDENENDDKHAENASIWNVLMERLVENDHRNSSKDGQNGVVRLQGHVRQCHDESSLQLPTVSVWNFYFVPLLRQTDDPTGIVRSSVPQGCACTCVGIPSFDDNQDTTTTPALNFKVEWRTVEDLISFHTGESTRN